MGSDEQTLHTMYAVIGIILFKLTLDRAQVIWARDKHVRNVQWGAIRSFHWSYISAQNH